MLEQSLTQLEHLVKELVKANKGLQADKALLAEQLQQVKDENDSLQLSALEQDDQHSATIARIQALVAVATPGHGATSNASDS